MTKQEFIDQVADQTDLSKRDATEAVEAVLGTIKSTLQSGGEISFTGFGKFHVAERGARQGVNPQTRGAHHDQGGKVPRFTAGLGAQAGRQGRLAPAGTSRSRRGRGRGSARPGRARDAARELRRPARGRVVAARESQIALGLDPDPAQLLPQARRRAAARRTAPQSGGRARSRAHCRALIEAAAPACAA